MIKQTEKQAWRRWWRAIGVVVVALVLGAFMHATLALAAPSATLKAASLAQSSPDHDGEGEDDFQHRDGPLVSRPDGNEGTWVISDTELVSYTANGETELIGELAVGACVDVKTSMGDSETALRIGVTDTEKCNSDDNDGGNDEIVSVKGIVKSRPDDNVGKWVIDEKTFTATESTEFENNVDVGACVEVKALTSAPGVAIKIEGKEAADCNGDDDGGGDDGGEHHGDDDERIVKFGILQSRPDHKEGSWMIGGEAYTVTERTEIDFDHGRLMPDVCVRVTVAKSNPTVAREIESERGFMCERDDNDDAKGTLFGLIEKLPADLHNGTWVIGGFSFVVSPTTELVDHGEVFTKGETVKVDFVTNISNTNFARRIEIKFGPSNPCWRDFHQSQAADAEHFGDDGRHSFGHCPGFEGKAMGTIDARPDGTLLGKWMIGGVPYLTNAFTKFANGDDFLPGEQVKVEYIVLNVNERFATKIMEVHDNAGGGEPHGCMIVGTFDEKPDAFIGNWVIDGAPFVAISDTIFIEHRSQFAKGAFVVVEYHITNNQRLIDKIVTHVPPGAGDEDHIGHLESVGASMAAASVDAPAETSQIWTVDGVNYTVTDASMLVDDGGALAPGATVYVNSYTDNGQRFATMIRTQAGLMFIPMATK